MKRIVGCAALAAVFVVGVSATAFAQNAPAASHGGHDGGQRQQSLAPPAPAASKVAEIQGTIPFADLTSVDKVYAAFKVALGSDATAIGALQKECGVPVSGSIGGNTEECLHTIAAAIADQAKSTSGALASAERDLVGARAALRLKLAGLAKSTFTVAPEVLAAANAACADHPGTQARFVTPKRFDCARPAFRVAEDRGSCTTDASGTTTCALTVKALGASFGRGDITSFPPPPTPEKSKGWCGGSTFCRVAVVTTTVVVVGMGVAYGVHMIKEGTASPVTVLR